ncbi:haloacid dehalogenase-like hydrolase [Paenibacillus rhizoplanae]
MDGVIGTELLFEKGHYTGTINGKNCKGEEKVSRIKSYLKEKEDYSGLQ